MKKQKNLELKFIFWLIIGLFLIFLAAPIIVLLLKSFLSDQGFTLSYYTSVVQENGFAATLGHSFLVSGFAACIASVVALVMAYVIYYTNVPIWLKQLIEGIAMLPMFLPTITYGFAIIYSFGKQGLITRLLGFQLFDIYGFWGLLIGYTIYTVPVAFVLIHNTMQYVDKKTLLVSKVMGDNGFSSFWVSVVRPLLGTLAGAFVQAFFLSFTDFGIPASVGGSYDVIASTLYNRMLGGIPDFNRGAIVAVLMLIPSVGSICILQILERFNIRYNRISNIDIPHCKPRDIGWGASGAILSCMLLSVFAVIFVVPLVQEWPYQTGFSLEHFKAVLHDNELLGAYSHSLTMALCTAIFGTMLAYGAALITARSDLSTFYKKAIDGIALITNAIPGMVLGVAYMFVFPGTPLQNTLALMILCNIIHYFSTPYLMMKNSLSKMNAGWETTAMLMGDSWMKTILRVVTPNALPSLLEVFSYYFINAMVTVSALAFISGAQTMVITTKIKQLQYINKFNEVFVLSLLILVTNLAAKAIFVWLSRKSAKINH